MNDQEYIKSAFYEHSFWLQILGDHSRFIHDTLSPDETKLVAMANHYIKTFDQLLRTSRKSLSPEEINNLSQKALYFTQELKSFKLHLLKKHLTGKIEMNMSPTFLNHMLNELEEYLIILSYLVNKQMPKVLHPLHYHEIWMLDAVGHAATIANTLDMIEKDLIEVSEGYLKQFMDYYHKTVELKGYLRTSIKEFPALSRFNVQAKETMDFFTKYLERVKSLVLEKEAVGSFSPLLADHMLREECYYLTKLALASKVEVPNCDATKPRLKY